MLRPSRPGSARRVSTPVSQQALASIRARRASLAWPRGVSWLSRSRWLSAAPGPPGGHDVEDHRVVDPHPGHQRLGLGGDELVVGLLGPGHLAVGGLAALRPCELLGVVAGLGRSPSLVLDDVLGRLDDDGTAGVEAGPPGAARDLVELASLAAPAARAVELDQPGEQHRADGHVDADAEGVGAADDLEQPVLGELLHQPPVARQHPGVVDPDAGPDQLGQRPPEAGGEPEPADPLGDRVLSALRCTLERTAAPAPARAPRPG